VDVKNKHILLKNTKINEKSKKESNFPYLGDLLPNDMNKMKKIEGEWSLNNSIEDNR